MGKKLLYTLLFTAITFSLKAEGYRISVKWEGLADSSIFLAHYYENNIFVNDTIQLNAKGEGIFSQSEPWQQGLYLLYQSGSNYFDFLLGSDQNFSITTTQKDVFGQLKISGAIESEDFLNYQRVLKNKSQEKNALSQTLKSENNSERDEALKKLETIDQEMKTFMEKEMKKSPSTMYNAFLTTANQIEVPDPPFDKNLPKYDSLAWFYVYNYRRDHFLEAIDFSDERIMFTPVLKPKLDTYFNKILIQSPDSIIPQAKLILKRAEPNLKMFQYVTQYLLNNSIQSKIMGMDAVFVAIADEVYLKGKATWADSTTLAKIAEEAYLSRPNLIGKQAPDFAMENLSGEYENLYLSQGDYTILVFYEYDCGHCKKEIPALYNDVYLKLLDHNIEVYAICGNDNHEKWEQFVSEANLEGWHHLWDPTNQSLYRFKYNVKTTPTMYLLDKDKKIIAKKLDNTNLSKLLEVLLKEK
ncbi:MAG: redoxin domain-containing protein [Prolixibacteraceae bacterium]